MTKKRADKRISDALKALIDLGMPPAQQNERSALCLLALLDLSPSKEWADADAPLLGITPIMDWVQEHYGKQYAPNTRETFRRQTVHQLVDAGIVVHNPDDPSRAVNSPKTVYQIEQHALSLLRSFGSAEWAMTLKSYLDGRETLIARYAKTREQVLVPVKFKEGATLNLSPGEHSELIRKIVEQFAPRFVPGAIPLYIGDTGGKSTYFDEEKLSELGVDIDLHGKMPDVVLYYPEQDWLVLAESVTSHGPVDAKRHSELFKLFGESSAGLVYVTAFPDRSVMGRYLTEIAWETEVWVAEDPSHLIHFNGERFLGPHT